ncbi:hypothetical protein QR680_010586 [Steinernema hermaphroditum]|uniref:Uncharacterized protein n=1 Tax=Steinernema hermaphroditum TaxID=289476 RepID=A0AA39MBZ0_9BILA|nr:hypothetical protein QR680_010586 [Steinernema hermaphroditum]
MKSLFDSAASSIVTSQKRVSLTALPVAIRTGINRMWSLLNFKNTYLFVREPIPDSFFIYDKSGSVDVRRTMENVEGHIHPISFFLYCMGTGLVDKLDDAWGKCPDFAQDELLQSSDPLVRFFAELSEYGRTDPNNDPYHLYLDAYTHSMENLALYLFSRCSPTQQMIIAGHRLVQTLKADNAREWREECTLLRRYIELKKFPICEGRVASEMERHGDLIRERFYSLPKECQMYEFKSYLMSDSDSESE